MALRNDPTLRGLGFFNQMSCSLHERTPHRRPRGVQTLSPAARRANLIAGRAACKPYRRPRGVQTLSPAARRANFVASASGRRDISCAVHYSLTFIWLAVPPNNLPGQQAP
jgi:hypothetical protein